MHQTTRQLGATAREGYALIALLVVGAIERLVWTLDPTKLEVVTSESHNVAVSLARAGKFADPLMNGSGYSAHVSMLTPLPSALAYWLFGIDTPRAELALSVVSIGLVTLSLWLCWRIAILLTIPATARIAAIAILAVVPLQFGLEVREARNWEVDWATVLFLWVLSRVIYFDLIECGSQYLAVTGAIAGVLFVLNPPAGLGAMAVMGLYILQNRLWSEALLVIAGTAIAVVILTIPWAIRNEVRMGEPILIRDNFGLELAISNYSGAVHPTNFKAEYLARVYDIHPLKEGPANSKLLAAGGERSYYRKLGREAWQWIWAHPGDFLFLSIRRYSNFYLPPRWFWGTFGQEGHHIPARQFLMWLLAIPAMVWLPVRSRIDSRYGYVLAAILGCSLVFIFVQPMLRYRYLVSSLMILLSIDAIAHQLSVLGSLGLGRYMKFREL